MEADKYTSSIKIHQKFISKSKITNKLRVSQTAIPLILYSIQKYNYSLTNIFILQKIILCQSDIAKSYAGISV